MNEIDDLMQHVYDYFLDKFHQQNPATQKDVFLSFEPIGTSVSPSDFKIDKTGGVYSPAMAVETLSGLVNNIPTVDANTYNRTGKTVEGQYSTILNGAFSLTSEEPDISFFNHVKSQALRTFENTPIGSLKENNPTSFHPAYATPTDWYDATTQGNWSTFTYSNQIQSNESTRSTSLVKLNPEIRRWMWQVLPPDFVQLVSQPRLLDKAVLQLQLQSINEEQAHVGIDQLVKPQLLKTALLAVNRRATMSAMTSTAFHVDGRIDSTVVHPLPDKIFQIKSSMMDMQRVKQSLLLSTTATYVQRADSLKISFDYCLVQVNRPWLDDSFLFLKNWYMPGYQEGVFSNGMAANTGIFPALPIAFIVAKDLTISDWADEETQTVETALSLGPFSLEDRAISQAETKRSLTKRGMQIIAWICQLMPTLPPTAKA
ncbi:hypothetical protein [Spirosoma foliorum]|uniref:Uncharacterized protein n=1 Tax=Spirosoma foliorum TaxID=2710596 RepID=A0A7G5GS89_9BACT|nr:hypothetical protein [Spirosoma foliorum]QMW01731.1 hypothetical protein H3H32_27860 [Spirosoma foliorum]